MKIIVLSDTHSDTDYMEQLIEKYKSTADYFIHLGDYDSDVQSMKRVYPSLNIINVRGNGDFGASVPETIYRDFCGINFMITHGHRFHVYNGVDTLLNFAKQNDCRYVLFGHLHVGLIKQVDGITLINPGSISCPRDSHCSYVIININETTKHVDVDLLEI